MARTPLYKAAEEAMIANITNGTWEVGRRLPNEFELADEFGVSQGTMRRALIRLEEMGLLNRKPGRGTLVAANSPDASASPAAPLTPTLCTPDGSAIHFEPFRARSKTRTATMRESQTMGCDRVAVLERTLKVDGNRAALESVAVPTDLLGQLDEAAPAALEDLLLFHGIEPASFKADARAEITDMSQSVALSVDRYTALLVVRTAAYSKNARVIARQIIRTSVPNACLMHL